MSYSVLASLIAAVSQHRVAQWRLVEIADTKPALPAGTSCHHAAVRSIIRLLWIHGSDVSAGLCEPGSCTLMAGLSPCRKPSENPVRRT